MSKHMRLLCGCLAATLAFSFLTACTVKRLDESSGSTTDEYSTWTKTGTDFNAAEYVAAAWDKRIIPIYEEQAVDYVTVMNALRADRKAATQKYGLRRETGEPYAVFKVRGTARVDAFDDSSRNGVLRVTLDNSTMHATLQVGPVLFGTAIRDSLNFIRFTDIGNQLQFADLADQLNARMHKDSVETLDLTTIAGKKISFLAAFKLDESQSIDDLVVTPVKITVLDAAAGK